MIVARHRLDPFALVGGEIGHGHGAAQRLLLGDERFGDVAFIECVAALRLQQFERLGQLGIAEDLAGFGLLAVDVPGLDRIGIELGAAALDFGGDWDLAPWADASPRRCARRSESPDGHN